MKAFFVKTILFLMCLLLMVPIVEALPKDSEWANVALNVILGIAFLGLFHVDIAEVFAEAKEITIDWGEDPEIIPDDAIVEPPGTRDNTNKPAHSTNIWAALDPTLVDDSADPPKETTDR